MPRCITVRCMVPCTAHALRVCGRRLCRHTSVVEGQSAHCRYTYPHTCLCACLHTCLYEFGDYDFGCRTASWRQSWHHACKQCYTRSCVVRDCIRACVRACMRACVRVCMHVCVCTCAHVCVRVHGCVHACVQASSCVGACLRRVGESVASVCFQLLVTPVHPSIRR